MIKHNLVRNALLVFLILKVTSVVAQNASLRVIHTSPGTPAVDVRLSSYTLSDPTVTNLSFPSATGYVNPTTGLYNAFVTVAGTQTVALSGSADLPAGVPISVFAIGSLSLGKDLNNNLQLKAVIDTFQVRPPSTATLVRVAHFSPDAPTVDVLAKIGESIVTLVEGLSFSDVTTNSIVVPSSVSLTNDSLLITPVNSPSTVVYKISFGDLLAGQVLDNNFTIAAIGLLGGSGEQGFRLAPFPVTTTGGGINAVTRVVHASPNTPAVDVYLNRLTLDIPQISNLAFPDATNFLSVPNGNYLAYASVAGSTSPALTAAVTLASDLAYSVFAIDTLRLGNALNNNLRVVALIDTFSAPPANTAAQVRVAHFSPDAPAVRVLIKLGADRVELLSNVSFLDFTTNSIAVPNTVNPTQDSIIIALPNGGADVYKISVADLLGDELGQGTTRFTVAAIGRLSLIGSSDPLAFQLKGYGTTDARSSIKQTETGKSIAAFKLSQNYPNPFNPSTRIQYQLPQSAMVQLEVFDIIGRKVASLVSERQNAGAYEVPFNATTLASGVYFYRLEARSLGSQAGSFTKTMKMLLVK